MTRPPTIEPMTVPTPPVTAAPPMKTAAMASSSQPTPSNGPEAVERADEDHAGEGRQDGHVHHDEEVDLLGLDAGELGGVAVAADRVDVPADDGAWG